ncbi:hypothetical protein JCM8547_000461 [Rhodosporidiobolus lusitaniae]
MVHPSTGPLKVPQVSFRPVPLDPLPALDNSLAPFGYSTANQNHWDQHRAHADGSERGRYLRWLQPMENELARQVEYDMDDQDQIWLDAVNADRKKEGHPAISYEVFEIVMDKIEKEWFDLTKNIPKKSNALPSEDSKCAICDDDESENSNAIVFCDGCNLAVHQDCYGVPYIPEGQWLCRKCTVSPEKPVVCVLCPNPYGAFKQTTTAQWAHLLCAIWIPDTGVSNTVYMEPVDGVEGISKSRWKLICYLCKKRVGACIQCANRSCYTAFHVTCAREYGLELKMKNQQGGPANDLKAYCDKHGENPAPPALLRALTQAKARGGSAASYLKLTKKKTFKTARGYQSSSSPSNGPPVIPAAIAEKVVAYLSKIKLGGKKGVVDLISRYWSLKREARRGAPLLKRIHLEPWTASATTRQASETDKAHKLELLRLLRNDLEKVRMLTEQVRKREKKKLERVVLLKQYVEAVVWPRERRLREVLGEVKALDKQQYFSRPVDREAVPDYYDVIKYPMDWSTMTDKLDRHEYATAADFIGDVQLVINNARRYNKPYTPVHRAAVKVLEQAESSLDSLEALDDPEGVPAMLEEYLSELVGEKEVAEMWDQGYDVEDPDGQKEKRRVEKAKRKEEEERRKEEERVEKEERAKEQEEKKLAAAATKKAGGQAKKDVKGKGKAHAEASPEPSPVDGEDDDDDAMDIDEPSASTKKPSAAAAKKGKKRSAAAAGLDDGRTPAPKTRTTRAAAAVSETPAPPAAKEKEKKGGKGRASVGAGGRQGKKEDAVEEEKEPDVEEEDEEEQQEPPRPIKPRGTAATKGKGKSRAVEEVKKTASAHVPSINSPKNQAVQLEDVKPSDIFTHFETGWILPEGSRRRSSAAFPPPAASTSKSTPAKTASSAKPAPLPSARRASTSTSTEPEPSSRRTPAAAANKGKGKAVEPVKEEEPEKGEESSGLSEVEESTIEEMGKKPAAPETKGRKKSAPPPSPAKRGAEGASGGGAKDGPYASLREWEERYRELAPLVAVMDETELDDGYLVWARMPGYASFPAEVVDPDDDDSPDAIRSSRPANWKEKVPLYFLGENRTTAWLSRAAIRELGENDEFDQLLLDPFHVKSVHHKAKRNAGAATQAREVANLRFAYEQAKDRMETEEDIAEREASTGAATSGKKGKGGGASGAKKNKAAKKRR